MSEDSLECKSYNYPERKSIWEMTDDEFADFMCNACSCDEVWERV